MLRGNWLVAQRLVTTLLYKLVRLVFIIVQRCYWHLNGTTKQLREARLPDNYERSAHVLDVVYCHTFSSMELLTIGNFLCTHNRFENPQYIIDNDNITLMTINERDAIFCEAREKDMHLWRTKYDAFIHNAQRKFIRRLIIVPLSTFHHLADTIGDPKGELTFILQVPRAGSTLLIQIMEYTGRCVSVSEPLSPIIVAMKYRKFGDSPEIRQLARDVLRWECRPYPTMQPQPLGYCLKIMSIGAAGLPLFRELFPSSRSLFIYRDVEKVAKSFHRSCQVDPVSHLMLQVAKLPSCISKMMRDRIGKMLVEAMGLSGFDYSVCFSNDLELGVFFSSLISTMYLDFYQRGFNIKAVRYEDLVARPLDMCRAILEFCHLPVSLAELAVKAFEVDSQRNSFLSRSALGRINEDEMTAQKKTELNELLKKYGMPLIGEPGILEGTLTCC